MTTHDRDALARVFYRDWFKGVEHEGWKPDAEDLELADTVLQSDWFAAVLAEERMRTRIAIQKAVYPVFSRHAVNQYGPNIVQGTWEELDTALGVPIED